MENITIEWVHAESGHRKGPPDGVDEPTKTVIDNIASYNLKKPITNTTEIITKWPATDIVLRPTHRMKSKHSLPKRSSICVISTHLQKFWKCVP